MKDNVWIDSLTSLGEYEESVRERLAEFERIGLVERLWKKDATLWKSDEASRKVIENAMGWLDSPEKMEGNLRGLVELTAELRNAGFLHVAHMGMGGSSLAPLAFQTVFGSGRDGLPVTVLDTTDPVTILKIERKLPIASTLFIEASKSGTTAESRSFGEYFYGAVKALKGDRSGENQAVITDPGSMLAGLAESRAYRKILLNYPDIGGRYSALSFFGLVPAALMGIDVYELLGRALEMVRLCSPGVPVQDNPGVCLGAVMGELASRGRNKLTLLVPRPIETLSMWLEQLIAESTGKEGVGILPVAGEPVGPASVYGKDRLFVVLQLENEPDESLDRSAKALQEAGNPVMTIRLRDRMDLGQELFRWEIATAVASVVLGINPFDQPNVQETKSFTNRLLEDVRSGGTLREDEPILIEGALQVYGGSGGASLAEAISKFLGQAAPGDFVALLAYLEEEPATERALQAVRVSIRDKWGVATTMGHGPRYLHSTGQLHKGGPNTGLFLLLTADDLEDASIPGQPYSFGTLKRAQALGDLQALKQHGRRVLRIHLGSDVEAGLTAVGQVV